ncbi:hypothetical protein [Streptomyces sp. NPDC050355]|uniref:hypothetical protein n=1 Tax=Streptomyces sp. NPDC050355 TaxID=3365609 RepID=UPI0037AE55FD
MLRRLLIDEDETGMPVDATLPSIFEAPYDDGDEEDDWIETCPHRTASTLDTAVEIALKRQ